MDIIVCNTSMPDDEASYNVNDFGEVRPEHREATALLMAMNYESLEFGDCVEIKGVGRIRKYENGYLIRLVEW